MCDLTLTMLSLVKPFYYLLMLVNYMAKTSLSADQQKEILRIETRLRKTVTGTRAWHGIPFTKLKAYRQKLLVVVWNGENWWRAWFDRHRQKERVSIFTATVRRRAHRRRSLCYDQAGLIQEKKTNLWAALWPWLPTWALNYWRKIIICYCRKRVNMIAKRPVGSARLPMSGSWEGAVRGFSIWTCICVS